MSKATFDPRDRLNTDTISAKPTDDRMRLMARSGGYVMVRQARFRPFVMTEKEWAKAPLFAKPDALEQIAGGMADPEKDVVH